MTLPIMLHGHRVAYRAKATKPHICAKCGCDIEKGQDCYHVLRNENGQQQYEIAVCTAAQCLEALKVEKI